MGPSANLQSHVLHGTEELPKTVAVNGHRANGTSPNASVYEKVTASGKIKGNAFKARKLRIVMVGAGYVDVAHGYI